MSLISFKINENILTAFFFITSLISALFYTGNNVWLFTLAYLGIIATLVIVLKQRFFKPTKISLNGILISATLLLTWFAISIFLSQIKYLSLYNFFWVGSLLIIFLIFTFNENKDEVWKTVWPATLFFVLIWAIYGLVQYYYLRVPTNATFLNRNSLAALINLALIPAVAYFLLSEEERPWKYLSNKVLSLTLIILFLTTFIITSRGASLSLFLGFIVLSLLLKKHIDRSQLYSLLVIIFIAFLMAHLSQYFIQHLPQGFAERMMSLKDTSEAGNPRFIIWKSLIPLFNEMPWYGLGLGSLWVFWPPYRAENDGSAGFFAHNDYMQFTLEAGYPGIILLLCLFVFILLNVNRALKSDLTKGQRFELVSLFAALVTFAAHSFFTYNFYILPLLIIAGLYLARINQLVHLNSVSFKEFPALKIHFKPAMFIISLTGLVFILCGYFLTVSFSSHYNNKAKVLMLKNKYQASNIIFLKAQALAPLMDNAFFSHADLLRRGASNLFSVNKGKQAHSLIKLAHLDLDKAEKLNPLRPQTHHIRGLIYEQNNHEKAKIEFEKALKLDPRFLFSRINLAKQLNKENNLKKALKVLNEGVNYNYPVNKVMLEYMTLFAKYSRKAGAENFALDLEANIKKFMIQSNKK